MKKRKKYMRKTAIQTCKMKGLDDLPKIFESETIKPSFKMVHVITALIVFKDKENVDGIGRYRLKKELNLTEGRVKSLLSRAKSQNLIETNSRVKGHILTEKGRKLLNTLTEKISIPETPKFNYQDIVIGDYGYCCIVKNAADRVKSGMAQRDEAIKIGASGATCLIYLNNMFQFPNDSQNINPGVQESELSVDVNNGDVLVIGTGESSQLARLGTIAAGLSLLDLFNGN